MSPWCRVILLFTISSSKRRRYTADLVGYGLARLDSLLLHPFLILLSFILILLRPLLFISLIFLLLVLLLPPFLLLLPSPSLSYPPPLSCVGGGCVILLPTLTRR